MRIVYLGAGAGGMLCGSCLHDNTLVSAMVRLGEQALLVPTYTPLRTDEELVAHPRIFYGGINVYLQEKIPLFRHTPWFVDRLLDNPGLISWLARRASATDAGSLGALTVSMLQGEQGRQRKELRKLVRWLAEEVQPEVVHLSNAMLIGMAREIHAALRVPVVATLSGEDIFLDKLPEPHKNLAWRTLAERADDVQAFVALNHYYAEAMSQRLRVDRDRIQVIPHGLNLAGHGLAPQRPRDANNVVTIGYLARICEDKGLHQLIEAAGHLARQEDLLPLRIVAAGYLGEADRPYLKRCEQLAHELGLTGQFTYQGELDREAKIRFLQSLDIMCLPTVYRESKGLPILEAWANGVPVVVPRHGTFPELIEQTGGGLLFHPGDAADLAEQLRRLVLDADEAHRHGRAAHGAISERFTAEQMARQHIALYQQLREPTDVPTLSN